MTKWVTLLLLMLAVLAYGLSTMRPVPEPSATPALSATEVPSIETTETTSSESTTESSSLTSPNGAPAQVATSDRTTKAPAFGLPGKTPNQVPSPQVTPAGKKVDPFAPKTTTGTGQLVTGMIKATVLAATADGPVRTKFVSDAPAIYVTVTPEGIPDEVEIVARYRSVMDEKAEFSEAVMSSGPPRRRVFRLTPPAEGWKSGPYQVSLGVKGSDQSLGLERFEILPPKESPKQDFPAPEYLDLVPDLDPDTAPQTTYSKKDPSILLRVSAQEVDKGTVIRSVWSAVEVDNLTSGELIAVSTQPAPGEGHDAVFTFEAPPGGFHTGSYKVDVYIDQQPAGSQTFFIQPPTQTAKGQ